MPTVEERYQAATAYVHRAISAVENRGFAYVIDPVTGVVEWYAGKVKTDVPRAELSRIQARWLRATRDDERGQVARDAELLADRVEENLPGAPQNRERTNLYAGERATATPPTTYYGEVADESREMWNRLKDAADRAADEASIVEKTLLVGGGLWAGWKVFDYLRERQRERMRSADGRIRRALDASLEHAASRRPRR
ncbi:MAG TPA: hypothetical protein VGL86_22000 [Polyangia bacterium]|jgi:hypothetical protein